MLFDEYKSKFQALVARVIGSIKSIESSEESCSARYEESGFAFCESAVKVQTRVIWRTDADKIDMGTLS